ncbi:alpha/beta hydrolase family protein [Consotaella aegiceratis]|uniref:alpha/beta hydrolase family protein n=1 Tax=Consotaella aegiceratis TaxID=3097961 RepID=UPI002F3E3F67
MKRALTALLLMLAGSTGVLADPLAGYDRIAVEAPHRARLVDASIWYPAATATYRVPIGENLVFKGTDGLVGAGIADGKFPLVLLSHGSGGNMDGLSWLSSALALKGALVLGVNHPGSTSGDSSPRRSLRLGERAADLSRALDQILTDPDFGPHIDHSRIAVLGFSLGGTTALNLAGARFDPAGFRDYCARLHNDAADCAFFVKGGVDFDHLPDDFAAAAGDPRITSTIAVDPGMTGTITPESLAAMTQPILLINLGDEHRWPAIDVSAAGSGLVDHLPNATYDVVQPAIHFTFLAECKPQAAALLEEEHDDPVCTDPAGADRAEIHKEIITDVAGFLNL